VRMWAWCIVGLGGVLMVSSVVLRLKVRRGVSPRRDPASDGLWLLLLVGLGAVLDKLPTLLGAPAVAVDVFEWLSALVAVATALFALRVGVGTALRGDPKRAQDLWLPAEVRAEVTALIHADQRIQALRVIRSATGLALKPAVDVMEALRLGVPVPESRQPSINGVDD
jgi:hypothetical protein